MNKKSAPEAVLDVLTEQMAKPDGLKGTEAEDTETEAAKGKVEPEENFINMLQEIPVIPEGVEETHPDLVAKMQASNPERVILEEVQLIWPELSPEKAKGVVNSINLAKKYYESNKDDPRKIAPISLGGAKPPEELRRRKWTNPRKGPQMEVSGPENASDIPINEDKED